MSFVCSGRFSAISYLNVLLPAFSPFLFGDSFSFLLSGEFLCPFPLQLFGASPPAERQRRPLPAGVPFRFRQPGAGTGLPGFQTLPGPSALDFLAQPFPSRGRRLIKCLCSPMIENAWMLFFTPGPLCLGIVFTTLSLS